MKKYSVSILLICILNALINAQSIESKIAFKEGNNTYKNGSYDTALINYESSFSNDTSNFRAIYNMGNASFMKGEFEDARDNYNIFLNSSKNNTEKANTHFNIGNSYLTEYSQQLKEQSEQPNSELLQNAIDQYKTSLRYNSDDDARHNLSYAMRLLQQNKDQQNKDKQNKDQQNKDQQNKDKQNKEQQNKDKQNKEQQNKDQQNNSEDKPKINKSKIQAMKNLDAVNSDEEKILLKVNRKKGDQKKKSKTKDW